MTGTQGGWRGDFPLDDHLPDAVTLDITDLELPVHPMFLLRLRVFMDWHESRGRKVGVLAPRDPVTATALTTLRLLDPLEPSGFAGLPEADDILDPLPLVRLRDLTAVEEVAGGVREILEYRLTHLSGAGEAAFMALSELGGNAVEHGANPLGAWAIVAQNRDRRGLSLAIADLGLGIPEHLRQRYPELHDDTFAIATALQEGVSGTGGPTRGYGLPYVLDAALTPRLQAARLTIHAASGFLRSEIVQGSVTHDPFPAAQYRRGTWVTLDIVSAET